MTDKEKIRAEIKRQIAELAPTKEKIGIVGGMAVKRHLESILSFIDTMQEEPAPKILEDMLNAKIPAESLGISQEEHDRIVDELIYGKETELVDVDDLPNKEEGPVRIKKGCKYRCLSDMQNTDTGAISFFKDKIYSAPKDDTLVSEENGWLCDTSENASNFELVEEPVSEEIRIDTIEEVKEIFKKELLRLQKEQKMKFETEPTERRAGSLDCINSILSSFEFVDFEEEEPVSKDLEEAAWMYYDKNKPMLPPEFALHRVFVGFFKAGAKWQKEQLMAKAIDAKIWSFTNGTIYDADFNIDSNLIDDDKVKVIVIKEE